MKNLLCIFGIHKGKWVCYFSEIISGKRRFLHKKICERCGNIEYKATE
jgi:hypothetical protein